MKKYLFMAVAAIAVLSGCSSDNDPIMGETGKEALTFTASMEGVATTRATYDATNKCASWETTDHISVNGKTYNAQSAGLTTTFKAEGQEAEGTTYNAYFACTYDGKTATLPSAVSETWTDGKFNMPMYAHSESTDLEFKNLCGVLKVTVTSGQLASVKSITVSSSNCATSGAFTVEGNAAKLTEASNTANTVTVTYTTAVSTDDAKGKVFYVAIPPQTYKNLSIAVSDGTTTKVMTTKKDQDITVNRNTVYPISFDGTLIAGTAKREGDIDVRWVQLWENGPKFAEYNVGVTDGKAESFGGYYCWGGSIDQDSNGACKNGTDALIGNDDTATKLWGSAWRMPTKAELEALLANCDAKWTTVNGVYGRKFTGKGGYASDSVFLPAAGGCDYDYVYAQGDYGYYWSSTPVGSHDAYNLYFNLGDKNVNESGRDHGYSVRAVLAETSLPDGALSGVFSVSGSKQVRFSGGNLYYDGSKFKFEANQYDTTPASDEYWSSDHISHFYWSKTASVAYAEVYNDGSTSDSDVFFTNADETTSKDDFTVNVGGTEQRGWRTLSKDEWTYLFNTRKVNGGTGEGKSYQRATINLDAGGGVYGMILYPDNYTGTAKTSYTSTEWETLENAGCVFLPAAGLRRGSPVGSVGVNGYYWSSSSAGCIELACIVLFNSSDVSPGTIGSRSYGFSVRLITESK